MKEYILDQSTFMGGWYMSEKICDEVLNYFEENESYHEPGLVTGVDEDDDDEHVDLEIKKSRDLSIMPFPIEMSSYAQSLSNALDNYLEKYEWADRTTNFAIKESVNIQRYKPGEGFYQWHMENFGTGMAINRHLVFMTYLNDVENGGTEFYYYPDLKIQARKGLTLIWPAGWTHTHKGVISNVEEKTIVTGWYSFYDI